tara:strand:+ start:47 stop:613 length:567 start_codon:yes stop_codon:yes gene_type:complete
MIYIKDNFLDDDLIKILNNNSSSFEKVDTPGKSFWVKYASEDFIDLVLNKVSEIEGKEVENILCFFREAKENQDKDWRIHNDSIINNQQPDRALVLYVSKENENELNGTAFWSHEKYGEVFDEKINVKLFNEMISNDSNDMSKWKLKSIIGHKQNRLISYPCNYFHSKYPNEFKEPRVVFVMFYKIKK